MRKLAIVGSHPETRGNAPFEDANYDIWVFNEAAQSEWCKRWDAVFQLHRPEVYRSPNNHVNKNHWQWLQQSHGKTIWMQNVDPMVPDSRKYPLDEIMQKVPGAGMKWFDLSTAYALALAMHLGYTEIEIYGMDLVSNTEYTYQLRCWNFWVGVALGAGIDLQLMCCKRDFGNGKLYAYEGEVQIERLFFMQRARELEAQWKDADSKLNRAKDLILDAVAGNRFDEVPVLVVDCQQKAIQAGELSGALAEAENYAAREDPISRQEFEKRSGHGQRDAEDFRAQMYHTGGKVEYVWNAWKFHKNSMAANQLTQFIGQEMKQAFDLGARAGIYKENLLYMMELDARITAAGGEHTLRSLGVMNDD